MLALVTNARVLINSRLFSLGALSRHVASRFAVVVTASIVALAAVSTSRADEPPEQLVWLKNGGFMRGELIEMSPNDHVTIRLLTGEVRKIPWAEVDHTSSAKASPATSVSPIASAPVATSSAVSSAPVVAPPAPSGSVASVSLASDSARVLIISRGVPMTLQGRSLNSSGAWRDVCAAPCDQPVHIGDQEFRVVGKKVTPTNPFKLQAGDGVARIEVKPGNPTAHWLGPTLLITGLSTAFIGFVGVGAGKVGSFDGHDNVALAGGITAGVGGLTALASIPLLFMGSSLVRNQKGEPIARVTPQGLVF